MKILHLASEYPPQKVYGLGRAVRELAVAQAGLGHDVHVVTNSMSGSGHEVDDRGVHVHRVHFPPPPKPADDVTTVLQFNIQVIERVANASFANGVDVVHSHDWLTGMAGIAVRSMIGAPLALTVHDTAYGKSLGDVDPSRKYVMDLERYSFSQADLLVCPSDFIRKEVAVAYGVSGRHVVVVPQGVCPLSGERDPEPGTVLFIGRLDPEKGVDVLLRAAGEVLGSLPEAKFLIAGTGKLEESLKQQARGLGDAVEFLGYVADPGPLYRRAAVVVVPSLYEPFGLVALEGMVCGRAVVVSRTGGLAEIVSDGNDGLLVPPGDAHALARAVSRLLNDGALQASLGEAGRRTCVERFTWDAVAKGYLAGYREVLRGPKTVSVVADDPSHPLAQETLKALLLAGTERLRILQAAESADLIHILRTKPEPLELKADVPIIETILTHDVPELRLGQVDHVAFAWHNTALSRYKQLKQIGLANASLTYPPVCVNAPAMPPDPSMIRQRLGLPLGVPLIGLLGACEAHEDAIRGAEPGAHFLHPTEEQIPALDVAVCPEPSHGLFRDLALCGLYRIPVVGPNRGILAELTEHQWGGMLNDGSPETCARDVHELIADPRRRREQGNLNHEIARTRFGADAFLERTLGLYERVFDRSERAPRLLLSIVVDVRNRKELLLRGLETLLQQAAPADAYEVIIVDYGGSDGLERALPDDPRVRYIYSNSRGIYSHGRARNIGIRAAKGDAIACVDADLLFPPHLVEALLALHGSDDFLAAYADVYRLGPEAQQAVETGERSAADDFGWLRDHAQNHFRQAPCGGLQSASRWAWESIHGYDEDYVGYGMEDVDMTDRFGQIGLRPVFHPEVYVIHQHHDHPSQYRTLSIDRRNHKLYAERNGQAIRNHGGAWGQRRPRPIPKGKPRVLLVADVPDWALDFIASAIAGHLADQFRFETIYHHPFDHTPIDGDPFDLIYFLFSGIWMPRAGDEALARKAIVGVHSHSELSPEACRTLARCRAVCTVSRRLLWECSERLSVPVAYTPSGVDTDLFRPRPRGHHPRFRVGWAGSLGPHRANKGLEEFLVPAVEGLPDVELVLATREHHALSPPEMVDFYNSLDCYACVSASEGQHLPLLEAGACGLPLVSTNVGAAPELIEPGRNGIIVERSVEHIRRAIKLLSSHRDMACKMGELNREIVRQSWSWEVLVPRYATFFAALLDEEADMARQSRRCAT